MSKLGRIIQIVILQGLVGFKRQQIWLRAGLARLGTCTLQRQCGEVLLFRTPANSFGLAVHCHKTMLLPSTMVLFDVYVLPHFNRGGSLQRKQNCWSNSFLYILLPGYILFQQKFLSLFLLPGYHFKSFLTQSLFIAG